MSGDEIIEDAIGPCNGSNKVFTTSVPSEVGTLWVWLNGQLILPTDDDGYDVINSSTYQMLVPPKSVDSIRHRYIEL